MKKKDEATNAIRQGNGEWDFAKFITRVPEPETPKDRFTQSFLYLDQAIRKNEEREKTRIPDYIHTLEEQQGIFIISGRTVNICEYPFGLSGLSPTTQQKEFMHGYARELRKFIEKATCQNFTPTNRYFAKVILEPNPVDPPVQVPLAALMDMDGWYRGLLIPLLDSQQRVVYQIVDSDNKRELVGAGFIYSTQEKELAFHEIKTLEKF